MHAVIPVALALWLLGCTHSVRPGETAFLPDSIVLERTLCLGTCPAYRLRLSRGGHVVFESRNPGDTARQERDTIAPTAIAELTEMADSIGFETLPDTIARSRALCPDMASDHPTAIVSIYRGVRSKRVVDYHGCFARSDHSTIPIVGRLRQLEASIDSVAGARRWIRPAPRRR